MRGKYWWPHRLHLRHEARPILGSAIGLDSPRPAPPVRQCAPHSPHTRTVPYPVPNWPVSRPPVFCFRLLFFFSFSFSFSFFLFFYLILLINFRFSFSFRFFFSFKYLMVNEIRVQYKRSSPARTKIRTTISRSLPSDYRLPFTVYRLRHLLRVISWASTT